MFQTRRWVSAIAATQPTVLLLSDDRQHLLTAFIDSGALPDLTPDFIHTLQEAFSELEKVVINLEDLRSALLEGGSPIAPDDLKNRFRDYLQDKIRGLDSTKVRIVLE